MAYRLKRKETVEDGVRRIAREQLQKAIDELRDEDLDRHEAVHQVRKRFKKLRGLVRLVRPGLGDTYTEINQKYRDAGRRFSRVRDAESLLEAVQRLRRASMEPPDEDVFQPVEELLKERRRQIAEDWIDLDSELGALCRELEDGKSEVNDWSFSSDLDEAVFDGMFTTYRRGRDAMEAAADGRRDEELHEWRKRVKYHWYHNRLLRSLWKPVLAARVKELDELSGLLGDDHDLAVLTKTITDEQGQFDSERNVRIVLGTATLERCRLQREAFQVGSRVFAEKPKALRKRITTYWDAWRGS